ncbi:MAG TPA: hypothetical protein VNM90_30415, partial [Haliangium sp.]|nr:hypothetical protein [Haliangium sp.]
MMSLGLASRCCRPRAALPALPALIAAAVLAGCGTARPTGTGFFGDTHAPGQASTARTGSAARPDASPA